MPVIFTGALFFYYFTTFFMALLKFGSIVTSGAGSLGGHTIQHSKGGMQLRTKPIIKCQPSESQSLIRSFNHILQAGWKNLTDSQRQVWNNYAKHPLCGHDLWMKYNFYWLQAGGSYLPDPSYWGGPILGSEKVVNGSFSSSSGWIYLPYWDISGGKANYLSTGAGNLRRNMYLSVGVLYLVEFDISDKAGSMLFRFSPLGGGAAFSYPFNAYRDYVEGHHSYQVTCVNSNDPISAYVILPSSTFSMDNLSIKQIF